MLRLLASRGPRAAPHSQHTTHVAAVAGAAAAAAKASLQHAPSCCAVPAHPHSVSSLYVFGVRGLHTSVALRIVSVGRARTRKLAERAAEEEAAVREAEREARTGSKLKALLKARAAAEEAEAAAAAAEQYRKPKIKKRGRAYEESQELLAEADMAQQQQEEVEAEEAARAAAKAEAKAAAEAEAPRRPQFPLDMSRSEEEAAAAAAAAPTPAPMLQSVEAQLRSLDATPALRHNVGGLGFDSIDLGSLEVVPSEVFVEDVPLSAGMRRLSEDRDRRKQFKRVERVAERTKEIIGRVLLEESIQIGAAQDTFRAQQALFDAALAESVRTGGPRPRLLRAPAAAQLFDLRRVSGAFIVHDVRYSTDLAWLQVRWTLNQAGGGVGGPQFAPETLEQDEAAERKQKRGKRAAATAKEEAKIAAEKAAAAAAAANSSAASGEPTLPSWSECKRLVTATLDHILPSLRFTLGRELDLRYTPNVRFVYDEAHAARTERERSTDKQAAADEALLRMAFGGSQGVEAPPAVDAALHGEHASLASAKSALLGLSGPESLELDARLEAAFADPDALAADRAMEREFDEHKLSRLPRSKRKQMAARAEERRKRIEARRKQKALLKEANRLVHGVSTRDVPTSALEEDPFSALDPSRGSDPRELRRQLQATLAKLMQKSKKERSAEDLKKIKNTRASMGMLQQLSALKKKADINPVAELKAKLKKDSVKQFPDNWKQLKTEFYRK